MSNKKDAKTLAGHSNSKRITWCLTNYLLTQVGSRPDRDYLAHTDFTDLFPHMKKNRFLLPMKVQKE